jgi:hypothetical protein
MDRRIAAGPVYLFTDRLLLLYHRRNAAKPPAVTRNSGTNPGSGTVETPQNAGVVRHKPIISAVIEFFIETWCETHAGLIPV